MDFVLRKITRTLRRKSAPVRGFEAASPEILESVDNFTRAVNNEMSASNCDACVQLFLSQFGSLDHNIYSQLDIAEPVTKLMREFITHFSSNLESYQPLDGAFLFLKIGVGDYVSDGLIENEISLLIVQILRSNSVLVLDASQSFVKAAMMVPAIAKVLFSDQFLSLIWENCYLDHENTYRSFGVLCSEMVRYGTFASRSEIEGFLKCVEGSLIDGKLKPEFAENAFMFLTMVIYRVNCDPFLERALPLMLPILEQLKNLYFFDFLLQSATSNVYLVVRIMEELLSNESIDLGGIQSLLDVLGRSESVHFNCGVLVHQMQRLDEKQQHAIFAFVNNRDNNSKLQFATACCPLDSTKVNPAAFSEFLMRNVWSDAEFQKLLDVFLVKNEQFLLLHMEDPVYMQISAYLLKKVSPETDVYTLVYGWLGHFAEYQATIKSYIGIVSHKGSRIMIAKAMLDFIENNKVEGTIFRYLSDYVLEYGDVADVFHRPGSLECLVPFLEMPECVDFLASLANSGPVPEIERFITQHFDKSPLSRLSADQLWRLALGLRDGDDPEGVIRIPSILNFVKFDNISIKSLSDKYALACACDCELSREELVKVSQFYINPSWWKLDSHYLLAISDPSQIHSSVYEFHFARRFCQAAVNLSSSLSFWVYFVELKDRTTVVSIDGIGKATVSNEGLRIFDGDTIPYSCGHWYLWTFVRNTNTFQADTLTFYLNDHVVHEMRLPTASRKVLFGSPGQTNGHWYIAYGVQASDVPLSAQQVSEIFYDGYMAFYPEPHDLLERSLGCKLIPYNGVRCYLKHFDIFSLILKANSSDEVLRLLHVADNLHQLKCVESSFFVNAVRYCVYEKRHLCNKGIELFVSDHRFICDYHILSMSDCLFPDIEVIDEHLAVRVLDLLAAFDLKPEKVISFLSILVRYIPTDPSFLLKVLMVIEVLTEPALVKSLLDVCFRYIDLAKERISVSRMFWVMTNSVCWLDILDVISPEWYDDSVFEMHMAHFIRHVGNRRMWIYLFRFLNGVKSDDIDAAAAIKRVEMLPCVCELLSRLVVVDEELSCEMISVLHSQLKQNETPLYSVIDSLRILFSAGFGQQLLTEYPFPISGEENSAPKLPAPARLPPFHAKSDMIKILTKRWHSVIKEYLNVSPQDVEFSEFRERPKDSFEPDKTTALIASIASELLYEVRNDAAKLKQALAKVTIMGADVDKTVVVTMHKLILMSFLERLDMLSPSSGGVLLFFLAFRVSEGWWDGQVLPLFTIVQKLFVDPSAAVKFFVLSCILRRENLVDILICFTSSPLFIRLISDDTRFFCVYVNACLGRQVRDSERFPELKQLVIEMLPESDFGMALSRECEMEWYRENSTIEAEMLEASADLLKMNREVFKNIVIVRAENTFPSNKAKYDSYYSYQNTYKQWLTQAFRLLLAIRINTECLAMDSVIARIQLVRSRQTKGTKYMVVHAPWPDVVPQKLVPKSYEYDIPESGAVTVSRSVHRSDIALKNDFMMLNRERQAAYCLREYSLRPFANCLISVLFKEKFSGTSSVFDCSLLGSTELLPSVGIFSKEGFHMVLNASLDKKKEIVLHDRSSVICHMETLESVANGFYGKSASLFFGNETITINFLDVRLALPRRYTYRNIGLDIFTTQGHHITILFSERERQHFLSKCKETRAEFTLDKAQKQWVSRELGNLKYLLQLNVLGGRSFNDFSQYPVVPWVIGDYFSGEIQQMRDLARPIGAQTKEHIDRYLTVFQETGSGYHYGTHYSHPAAVLHFMVRVEPMTLYALNLHSGWDHKDRMFYDVGESWKSVYESKQLDTKELIPEFYCFPSILENANKLPLQNRSDGQSLSDVVLPPWAKNPMQFVWKMRAALESKETTHNINNWIDLIFGYKQRGHAAVDAINCYHPCCYDTILKKKEGEDELSIEADKDAINNFGQCPIQIFTTPHPIAEAEEIPVIGHSPANIVPTVLLEKDARSVVVHHGKVFASVANIFVLPDGKVLYVEHGFLGTGNMFQQFFAATTSLSPDGSLVAVGSANGLIRVYTNDLRHVATCIWDVTKPDNVIVSPKHFLICAQAGDKIALFDTSSERLMKEHICEGATTVAFDDASNFLVVGGKSDITVWGLDFRFVARGQCSSPFTSITCGQPHIWREHPVYASGHEDGSVLLWKLDVCGEVVVPEPFFRLSTCVRALSMYHNNQALIAVSENGDGMIAAVERIRKKVVDPGFVSVCRGCDQPLSSNASVCALCGFPFCKTCKSPKNAKVCAKCAP